MFSIAQLQQFSGIKAHTIRIWEQRYNALTPNRTAGNTRYYDHAQFRRLLNIVSLLDSEYKVSQLCGMTDQEHFKILEARLQKDSLQNQDAEYFVSQLIASGMSFDEQHFEKIFASAVIRFGLLDAYVHVIYPMFVRIGLMWANNTYPQSQEHFVSNLVRRKLFAAIERMPMAANDAPKWVLFLPENEYHEIGLLFAYYIVRQSGAQVTYLGSNVPFESLTNSIEQIKPDHLLFFLVHLHEREEVQAYVSALRSRIGPITMHLSGNPSLLGTLKMDSKMNWLSSVDELVKITDEDRKAKKK